MAKETTSRAWQSLPECVAVTLGRLDAPEVQRLQLVCKDWRRGVSMAFTGKLTPKKLAPAAAAFPHSTSLSCRWVKGQLRSKDLRSIRHLKQLSSLELVEWRIPSSYTFSELTRLPSLTRLTLRDCKTLEDLHLSALVTALQHLRTLDFSYCKQITSKGVACLSLLRNLEALCLDTWGNIKIDDKGLEQLCHCTRLHTLDISDVNVTGSFLSKLTSLRSLTARGCFCEGRCGPLDHRLAGLTNLTHLDVGENSVTIDASSVTMQTLPLKHLYMDGCHFNRGSGTMAAVATVTTLESLRLYDSYFEEDTASQLMALTRLTDLDLSGCGTCTTQGDPMGISALKELRSLKLAICSFALTIGVCERIATLTKLEVLDISGIDDGYAALQHFTALIKLSRLTMAEAGLLSTSSIARLTTLTALVIDYTAGWAYRAADSAREEIDRDLLELAALTRLKELDISKDQSFINADCHKLAKLTSLETLHISKNPISLSGFKALLRLPRLRTLYCDNLRKLADSQYAYYKNCFGSSLQMLAPDDERRIKRSGLEPSSCNWT